MTLDINDVVIQKHKDEKRSNPYSQSLLKATFSSIKSIKAVEGAILIIVDDREVMRKSIEQAIEEYRWSKCRESVEKGEEPEALSSDSDLSLELNPEVIERANELASKRQSKVISANRFLSNLQELYKYSKKNSLASFMNPKGQGEFGDIFKEGRAAVQEAFRYLIKHPNELNKYSAPEVDCSNLADLELMLGRDFIAALGTDAKFLTSNKEVLI